MHEDIPDAQQSDSRQDNEVHPTHTLKSAYSGSRMQAR
jgi:hypothetical protein